MDYRIVYKNFSDQLPAGITLRGEGLIPKQQFYFSRLALLEALSHQFPESKWPACQNLSFDYLSVEGRPDALVSLAHTKDLAIALAASAPPYLSVGIDLEKKNRVVKEGAHRHYLNQKDDPILFERPLLGWTLKEAAFKALDPIKKQFTATEVLVLKDLWVNGDRFGLNDEVIGLVYIEELLEDYWVAVATIPYRQ
ncbi:MAG: hypothetical protein HN509_08570 [Halobacteriovoraceae bacterium]|jgi:phosphopantetheinyl transferase (holo-ACP synthase)|nr:hypothetical protein [Halobacteriovoraceae bacterium]MBT5095073.1 hypothetical protein [Halobacteriovoraceae bacterium]